jgi:hypothetical protein
MALQGGVRAVTAKLAEEAVKKELRQRRRMLRRLVRSTDDIVIAKGHVERGG